MEALLIIGALAYGMHHYHQAEDQQDPTIEVGQKVVFNEGLEEIDWSKAGNFRMVSTQNDVKWVVITDG
jgi:hypothetical protein|tara:strand:+ start:243 stop:449 length:207 start_codon:yes stop_codon:yes gene_type:complete